MIHRTGVSLIVIALAGCAQPEVPPDNFYRLYPESAVEGRDQPRFEGVLVVNRFQADGLVSERSLVYADDDAPNPLKQYHYHYWTESPTRMLQELVVRYLRSANVATQVITPETPALSSYEVSGKIKRLEQIRGSRSRVVVELEFVLTRSREASVLWVQDYLVEATSKDDSVKAAVEAFNQAIGDVCLRLVNDLWRN